MLVQCCLRDRSFLTERLQWSCFDSRLQRRATPKNSGENQKYLQDLLLLLCVIIPAFRQAEGKLVIADEAA